MTHVHPRRETEAGAADINGSRVGVLDATEHLVATGLASESREAERSLLGACMLAPARIADLGYIQAAHFVDPFHARLWGILRTRHADGRDMDPVLVAHDYRLAHGGPRDLLQQLADITEETPRAGSAPAYAATLDDCLRAREAITIGKTLAATGDAHAALRALEASLAHTADSTRCTAFVRVDADIVRSQTLLEPEMVVAPIIPRGFVTMLTGHGGGGKTTLAYALAAHVACARPWGGFEVKQGNVLVVQAEDPGIRAAWSIRRVIQQYGLPQEAVLANLVVVDASEGDATLAAEVSTLGVRSLLLTRAFDELAELMPGMSLVVIDNASDVFGGDENNRRQVRTFLRALGQLARKHGAAVLLVAHIDKNAARYGSGGESYSGSTAWHNSARSRIALVSRKGGGLELVHEKSNFTARAASVPLDWHNGVLMPAVRSPLLEGLRAKGDAQLLLSVFATAEAAGEAIPAAMSGQSTAIASLENFAAFATEFGGKEGRKRAREALMSLRAAGRLVTYERKCSGNNLREFLKVGTHADVGDDKSSDGLRELVSPPIPPCELTHAAGAAEPVRELCKNTGTHATHATHADEVAP